MSKTKFTNGNWEFDGELVMSEGTVIADPIYTGDEEVTANAHLIAAAPEMYVMLETVLNVLDGRAEYTHEDISKSYIQKLLAKARGE